MSKHPTFIILTTSLNITVLHQKETEKPGGKLLHRGRIHDRVLGWRLVPGFLWRDGSCRIWAISIVRKKSILKDRLARDVRVSLHC